VLKPLEMVETTAKKIIDDLKGEGIVSIEYESYVEGGRSMILSYNDSHTTDESNTPDAIGSMVDALFPLLYQLNVVPEKDEGEDANFTYHGMNFTFRFWA